MGLFSKIFGFFSGGGKTKEPNSPKNSLPNDDSGIQLQLSEKCKQIEQLEKKCTSLMEEVDRLQKSATFSNTTPDDLPAEIQKLLANIASLKGKIKKLEDENEEFESDLEDTQKKLKKKDVELNEHKEQLETISRQYKKLQNELDSLKIELEKTANDLESQKKSLAFVQELLCAKKASDASVQKLYGAIESFCDFVCNELKESVTSVVNIDKSTSDSLFNSGLISWAITKKKSWIQGKTSIAFVGEFSAGKTSIVNRILSQDNPNIPKLPVSTKATTAIPTYISGGAGTFYQFVTPNNELKNISEETFKRVDKGVLDNIKGVSSLIQYFVMTYKNPNLSNLSILDTPGFSNDKEDTERTIGVINECDALFWIFDVNAGTVNRSSIELIKKHLKKPLYVVINKVDTKPSSEVDKVEALIKKTLIDSGLTVQGFIRFSSNAPLTNIMNPIKGVKHDSSKEAYLYNLQNQLSNWRDQLEKEVQTAKREADNISKQSSQLVNQYNYALQRMANDSATAAGIPQFTEHWFKKDNYEMSQADYRRMYSLLDAVSSTHIDNLCNLYNEQMETVSKLENAWNAHSTALGQWRIINDRAELLKKKINELNTL